MIYKTSNHCPISLCLTSLWPFLAWSLFQVVLPLVSHPVSFFSSPASFSLQAQLSKTPAPPSALTGPHPALPALCAALVPKHIRKSISVPGCYRQGQKVQRDSFAIFKTSNQSSGFFCPRALAISLLSDAQFVQQQTQGTESKWGCRVYKKQIAQLMSWWKLRADSVWKSITSSSEHQIFIMKSGLGLKAVFFSQKRVANLWNLESGCTVNASWTAWVTLAFYTQSTQDSVFCLFFLSLSLIVVVEHNTEITIFWKQQT